MHQEQHYYNRKHRCEKEITTQFRIIYQSLYFAFGNKFEQEYEVYA